MCRSESPLLPSFISRNGNNIVIVPLDPSKPIDQQQKSEKKPINEDVNKKVADVKDLDKTKKVYSWASNYLQSIGHNNLKPVKINLSSSKNKAPTETTTAAGNKEKDNPNHLNYPCKANKKFDVHIQGTPRVCETAKTITPIPNSCIDTIYSNSNNAITPAYATLFATRAESRYSRYIYQSQKRSYIQRHTRMMDLPNHKKMCENFIKEINKTKPPKRKADYSSSSTSTEKEKSEQSESSSPAKKKKTDYSSSSSFKKKEKCEQSESPSPGKKKKADSSTSTKKEKSKHSGSPSPGKKKKADYSSSSSSKKEKSEHPQSGIESPSPAKKKTKTTKPVKEIEKLVKNYITKNSEADRVKKSKSENSEYFESPLPAKMKTKTTKHVNEMVMQVKKDKNHITKNSEADRVKKSQSEKSEHSESPSRAKKKTKTTKPVKEIEKPVKKYKNLKTKNTEADRVKQFKSQLNTVKPDIKKRKDGRSTIDLKDCIKKKETTDFKLKSLEKNIPKRNHKVCKELHKLRPEMTSHSSIQSVVQVSETHQSTSPKNPCKDENFDLRSTLSRVNERINRRNYHLQRQKNCKPKINTPMDNLKITVDNKIPEKQKSPKKVGVSKPKPKKCKKLKVIINVVCKESDDDSSSNGSSFSETENNQTQNMDLSFLDDFNVDEIVDSLKESPIKKTAHENSAQNKIEPELKLSKVLSILNAKTNKNKNIKTDCKAEEVITNSVTLTEPRLVSHAEIKGGAEEEKKKQGPQILTQCKHVLEKLLAQNNLQLEQQNAVPDKEPPCDSSVHKYIKIQEGSTSKIKCKEIVANVKNINANNDKENKIHSDIDNQKKRRDNQKVHKCVILNTTKKSKKENNNTDDNKSIIDLTSETDVNTTLETYIMDLTEDDEIKTNITPTSKEPLIEMNATAIEPMIKITQPTIQLPLMKKKVLLTEHDEIKSNIADITPTSKEPLIETKPTFKEPLIKTMSPTIQLPLIRTNVNITEDDEIKSNIADTTPTSKEPFLETKPAFIEPLIKTCVVLTEDDENKINIADVTPNPKEPLIKTKQPTADSSRQPTIQVPLMKTNVLTEDDKIKSNKANISPTFKEPLNKTTPTSKEPLNKTTPTSKEPLNKTTPTSKAPLIKTTLTKTKPNKTTSPTITNLMKKAMEEKLHVKMKVINSIRHGRFSTIYSCQDPSGQTYIAKLQNICKNKQKQGEMLTKLQQSIPQQNLNTVFLVDGFAVINRWCLIMEYYPKTLQQALDAQDKTPFHICEVYDLASQLISALMLLKNNKIIHSDINPSHILLNAKQNKLKVCGFDRAYYKHEAYSLPNIGTTNYRAPEIILGFSSGYSIDVWASALVIYEMATNKLLFKGIFNNEILYQQMSTFGDLPWDMVQASRFQYHHFRGGIFMRRLGAGVEDSVPIHKFFQTNRLHESIILTNQEHWFVPDRHKFKRDMFKLNALSEVLHRMLVLDPRKRITVGPFLFSMFCEL